MDIRVGLKGFFIQEVIHAIESDLLGDQQLGGLESPSGKGSSAMCCVSQCDLFLGCVEEELVSPNGVSRTD